MGCHTVISLKMRTLENRIEERSSSATTGREGGRGRGRGEGGE